MRSAPAAGSTRTLPSRSVRTTSATAAMTAPTVAAAARPRTADGRGAAGAAGGGVGDHEQLRPADAGGAEAGGAGTVGRTGMDEEPVAAPRDRRRIALPDVKEGDPQPRRRGEPSGLG